MFVQYTKVRLFSGGSGSLKESRQSQIRTIQFFRGLPEATDVTIGEQCSNKEEIHPGANGGYFFYRIIELG